VERYTAARAPRSARTATIAAKSHQRTRLLHVTSRTSSGSVSGVSAIKSRPRGDQQHWRDSESGSRSSRPEWAGQQIPRRGPTKNYAVRPRILGIACQRSAEVDKVLIRRSGGAGRRRPRRYKIVRAAFRVHLRQAETSHPNARARNQLRRFAFWPRVTADEAIV